MIGVGRHAGDIWHDGQSTFSPDSRSHFGLESLRFSLRWTLVACSIFAMFSRDWRRRTSADRWLPQAEFLSGLHGRCLLQSGGFTPRSCAQLVPGLCPGISVLEIWAVLSNPKSATYLLSTAHEVRPPSRHQYKSSKQNDLRLIVPLGDHSHLSPF